MSEIKEVELLNMTDEAMEETKIEVIDYMTLFGIEIDRDTNHDKGLHKLRKVGGKEDFLAIIPLKIGYGDKLKTLLQFDLRIETAMKLNLIDAHGNHLIKKEDREDVEVHHMRFECVTRTLTVDYTMFTNILGMLFRKTDTLEFADWTLVDLDDSLQGNMPIAPIEDES